jgi:hypothetical protein
LLLDLKSDLPHLIIFHLLISPLCFQIFHQPWTQNPDYRRQHPEVSVKVKCLEISRFVFHSYHNSSRFCVRCVKQFISVAWNIWKSTYIFCWNQEWTEFGLEVKPLNSFLLVTIIKLTITVSNSIAQLIVLNVLYYEMRVNIRNFYSCTSRNSYRVCIDTGYIVVWFIIGIQRSYGAYVITISVIQWHTICALTCTVFREQYFPVI